MAANPFGLKMGVALGAVTMGGSQAVKILVQFASVVVLSRLLSPEDFGITAAAAPLVAFLGIFQDFGFQQAIVQRQDISERDLTSIYWTVIALSVAVLAIMVAASPLIAWFFHDDRLMAVSIATALPLLVYAVGSVQMALLNRQGDFAALAINDIIVACLGLAAAVLAAMAGLRYWSLVVGALASSAGSTVFVLLRAKWLPGRPSLRWPGGGIMHFGSNLTGFTVVNFFSRNADNILIGHAWGGLELGLYDRAYKLLLLPLQNVAFPASRIMVPILSRVQANKPRLRELYLRAATHVSLATVPGMAAMVATGPHVVQLIFGPAWAGVAPIFVCLGIVGLIQPLNSTTGWLYISQGKPDSMFRLSMIQAPITIGAFLAGLHWGAVGVAFAYAATGYVIQTPLSFYWVSRLGPVRLSDLAAIQLPLLAAAGLTWLVSHMLLVPAGLDGLALIVTSAAASYGLAVLCLLTVPPGRAALQEAVGVLRGAILRVAAAKPAVRP